MKRLYHFTEAGKLFGIGTKGLKPFAYEENAVMTANVPIVWLTNQESNAETPEYLEWYARRAKPKCRDDGLMFGGATRITVNLARHDKRLIRYTDFLRKQGYDLDAFSKLLPPGVLSPWWVYKGVIPPHKIDITAGQLLQGAKWQVGKGADCFASYAERLAHVPPETRVNLEMVQ